MKRFLKLGLSLLVAGGVVGTALGVANRPVEVAKAADADDPIVLKWMFDSEKEGIYGSDCASFGLHLFGGTEGTGTNWNDGTIDVIDEDGDGIYSYDVSSYVANGHFNVIFIARDESKGIVQQTIDLDFRFVTILHSDYEAIYKINGNKDGKFVGEWSLRSSVKFTNLNTRIWFDRQGAYEWDYFWTLHIWDESGIDVEFLVSDYKDIGSQNARYVGYFDVPITFFTNGQYSVQLKAYESSSGLFKESTETKDLSIVNPAGMLYIGTEQGAQKSLTCGAANNETRPTKVENLVPVFEAYFTCLDNNLNGYGAINDLENNWLQYIDGDLSSVTIEDYVDTSDYAYGKMDSVDLQKITLQSKVDMMKVMANNNSSINTFGIADTDSSLISIVVVVSILAISSIAIVFVSKKRKRA